MKIPSFKFNRKLKFILGTVLVLAFLYLIRSLIFAAWVNTRPIFRWSLVRELEKQGGQSVINNLIEKSLIFQEAARSKIRITDEDLNNELKKVEDLVKAQGLSLEEALAFRGQNKNDLREQIKLQKIVESLLSARISVSDEEIKNFFQENKSLFEKGATLEKVKDQVRDQLLQVKLNEEYRKWIDELKAKAKIFYFVKY